MVKEDGDKGEMNYLPRSRKVPISCVEERSSYGQEVFMMSNLCNIDICMYIYVELSPGHFCVKLQLLKASNIC